MVDKPRGDSEGWSEVDGWGAGPCMHIYIYVYIIYTWSDVPLLHATTIIPPFEPNAFMPLRS